MAFGSENESETKMEGWLYIIRSNRFGLHFSRKRYFVLRDHLLKSFKSISDSKTKVILIAISLGCSCSPLWRWIIT